LKERLFAGYSNIEDFGEAYKIAKENSSLKSLQTFYPPAHPKLGVFHFSLGSILMLSRETSDGALEHFNSAKDILSVSHSKTSRVIADIEGVIRECRDILK